MKSSPLFKLNTSDLLKGLLMSVLTPVVYIIQASLEAGEWSFNLHNIGLAAISGGFAYIVKNFFTPAEAPKTEEPK